MQAKFLELAKKHDVAYGDVQKAWQQSAEEARKKRFKPGTPKSYEYRFNRLEEILLENKAQSSSAPINPPANPAPVVEAPEDDHETPEED